MISPVIISATSIGIYYALPQETNNTIKEETYSKNDIYVRNQLEKNIFPNITFDEIYDEIIMENNKPVINDQMIAKFIKIVFMRIKTSYGKIKVDIAKQSKQLVEIKFSWIVDTKIKEEKIYKMELNF